MGSQEGTALVILVPEAETLVQAFRDQYDPSAAEGMPALITVLYPFKPADKISKSMVEALQSLFLCHSPFRFSLTDAPDVVLLTGPALDGSMLNANPSTGQCMNTKRLLSCLLLSLVSLSFADLPAAQSQAPSGQASADLNRLLGAYWEDSLRLNPITATFIGDGRYNDQLSINIGHEHRGELKAFYSKYLSALAAFDMTRLNREDKLNCELLRYRLKMELEGLSFHDELTPVNQIRSLTLLPAGRNRHMCRNGVPLSRP